jgi:outer membrane protein OmpA-like peptidoglycan-associated protein
MNMTLRPIAQSLIATAALLAGCAHESSSELHTARSLYSQAEQSSAASMAQSELYEAKKALDQAESLKKRKRGSELEEDLAYVAARKSQYAMTVARQKAAVQDEEMAAAEQTKLLEHQRDMSARKLSEREDALALKEKQLAAAEAQQAKLRGRLDTAMASLSEMAKLEDKEGKMVITLNGSVLFKSASTTLLPTAQQKLAEVASVLKEYDKSNSIVIEGHTDARGGADYNATLSLHRAQAVERFLEGQGVSDEALKSVGRGESEPIADNKSAEGRANNRRVEIVIDKDSVANG